MRHEGQHRVYQLTIHGFVIQKNLLELSARAFESQELRLILACLHVNYIQSKILIILFYELHIPKTTSHN